MADYGRGICPECQRVISGLYLGIDRRKIELKRHKNLTRTNWCNGGRKVVQAMMTDEEIAAVLTAKEG